MQKMRDFTEDIYRKIYKKSLFALPLAGFMHYRMAQKNYAFDHHKSTDASYNTTGCNYKFNVQ